MVLEYILYISSSKINFHSRRPVLVLFSPYTSFIKYRIGKGRDFYAWSGQDGTRIYLKIWVGIYELAFSGSEYGSVCSSLECGNEPSCSTKYKKYID
jgi:hypothetical protein